MTNDRCLHSDRRGVSAVEYGILLVGILLLVAGGYRLLGGAGSKTARVTTSVILGGDAPTVAMSESQVGGGNGPGMVCNGTSCTGGPGGCFVAGTPVSTAHGEVPIETVGHGDLVLSRDEATGEVHEARVLRTFVHTVQELVDVAIVADDGRTETVRATLEHPFWSRDRGWTGAGALLPGEALRDQEGGIAHVAAVTALSIDATVYNFEVENTHTYFVGHLGTWVHNACNPFEVPPSKPPGAGTQYILHPNNNPQFYHPQTFWMNTSTGTHGVLSETGNITLTQPTASGWFAQQPSSISFNGQYVGLQNTATHPLDYNHPLLHNEPGTWIANTDVVFTDTLSGCTVVVWDASLLHIHSETLSAAPYNGNVGAYLADPQHHAQNMGPANFTVTPHMYDLANEGAAFLYGVRQGIQRQWYLIKYPKPGTGGQVTTDHVGQTLF